jgi:hypothetical protein
MENKRKGEWKTTKNPEIPINKIFPELYVPTFLSLLKISTIKCCRVVVKITDKKES